MRSGWHACWDAKLHVTGSRARRDREDIFEVALHFTQALSGVFAAQACAAKRVAASFARVARAMEPPAIRACNWTPARCDHAVACPVCGAARNEVCTIDGEHDYERVHNARVGQPPAPE